MPKRASSKRQSEPRDPQQTRLKHELKDDPTQALEEGEPALTGRTRDQKQTRGDNRPSRAKPPGQIGRHGDQGK
jgi:hypothetical protein